MKRLFMLLTVLLVFAIPIQAQLNTQEFRQNSNGSGATLYIYAVIDSLGSTYDSVYSNTFSFEDYDGLDSAGYGYDLTFTSEAASTDSINIDVKRQISYDGTNWLAAGYLLNDKESATIDGVYGSGTIPLTKPVPYERLLIYSNTASDDNLGVKIWIYLKKRDY